MSTVLEFLDLDGLGAIEIFLGRVVRLPPTAGTELGNSTLLEIVRTIRVVSNTEVGLRTIRISSFFAQRMIFLVICDS